MDVHQAFDRLKYCPMCCFRLEVRHEGEGTRQRPVYSCQYHGDFRLRGKDEDRIERHETVIVFEIDPLA